MIPTGPRRSWKLYIAFPIDSSATELAPVASYSKPKVTSPRNVIVVTKYQVPSKAPLKSNIPNANSSLSFLNSGYRKTVIATNEIPISIIKNEPYIKLVESSATILSKSPPVKGVPCTSEDITFPPTIALTTPNIDPNRYNKPAIIELILYFFIS